MLLSTSRAIVVVPLYLASNMFLLLDMMLSIRCKAAFLTALILTFLIVGFPFCVDTVKLLLLVASLGFDVAL